MKFLIFIIFISLSFTKNYISLEDRFLVPIYIKYGVSFGYNDNIFRFSEHEKKQNDVQNYMGSSTYFDDSLIKPEFRLLYSPYIFSRTTNFILFSNTKIFSQSKEKNSNYLSVRFEQKFGPYNWLKVGYKLSTKNLLRFYEDNDLPYDSYRNCSYDSESIYINYSINFKKIGWSRIQIEKIFHYFNPDFTEFDLDIDRISVSHNFKINGVSYSLGVAHKYAKNSTFSNGLNSAILDRSFSQIDVKFSYKQKLKNFLDYFSLGFSNSFREYLSEVSFDSLHLGREHKHYSFFISIIKELRNDISIELKYNTIYRDTKSDYDWVQMIKTFNNNQINLKFSYKTDLDLFY